MFDRDDPKINEKKVWAHKQISPDPHRIDHFYSIQELQGCWLSHPDWEESEWEDPEMPQATRVVLMKIDHKGFASNVHSPYNGPRKYNN